MARIRTIKPEFHFDERLSALPEATHLLAAALLNYADDDGFFNANPKLVKASCSPLREPSVSVQDSLTALSHIGYLRLGKTADGKSIGQIVNFKKHQVISRPSPSRIGTCEILWEDSRSNHGAINEGSSGEGKGMEQGSGTGNGMDDCNEPAKRASLLQSDAIPDPCDYPVFPCVPGRKRGVVAWRLPDSLISELASAYPAVDVSQESRKAHAWCKTNAARRKTAEGMPEFLRRWVAKCQDKSPVNSRDQLRGIF